MVPRAELKYTLDINNQSLQFLPDILRHLSPQILEEETHTAILWEKEGVKTHTLAFIKGSQGNVRGLKPSVVRGTIYSPLP
jgi:hypothetical protein